MTVPPISPAKPPQQALVPNIILPTSPGRKTLEAAVTVAVLAAPVQDTAVLVNTRVSARTPYDFASIVVAGELGETSPGITAAVKVIAWLDPLIV